MALAANNLPTDSGLLARAVVSLASSSFREPSNSLVIPISAKDCIAPDKPGIESISASLISDFTVLNAESPRKVPKIEFSSSSSGVSLEPKSFIISSKALNNSTKSLTLACKPSVFSLISMVLGLPKSADFRFKVTPSITPAILLPELLMVRPLTTIVESCAATV